MNERETAQEAQDLHARLGMAIRMWGLDRFQNDDLAAARRVLEGVMGRLVIRQGVSV